MQYLASVISFVHRIAQTLSRSMQRLLMRRVGMYSLGRLHCLTSSAVTRGLFQSSRILERRRVIQKNTSPFFVMKSLFSESHSKIVLCSLFVTACWTR